ncbi:hypothetical protein AUK40_04225 [Candidatus Wirthbacteria bacterium CG2_30_54_11]|uniref:Four helix bundle protein n=1 Tax=Candidatus Wirthbacteria bacterium CG2_30_54_11 TaxID=1817892 RepID=A0A1J5IRD6_9BACT|nr:MAG: hypothetical protein AUK40_04225 [Candidatus Wirthbacteria bacterium CG2_30_54_11]
MLHFNQMDVYDDAKKYLLYCETISQRMIMPVDDRLDHKIRSSLITLVSTIARSSALVDTPEYNRSVIESVAWLHEIAAGFDIAHDKKAVDDEMFAKLKAKTEHLLSLLKQSK